MNSMRRQPRHIGRGLLLAFVLAAVFFATPGLFLPARAGAAAPSLRPGMPDEIRSWREEILSDERYQALAEEWRVYLDKHPKSAVACIQLARALRYAGSADTEERQRYIRRALQSDPDCPEALDAIACTAMGSDRPLATKEEACRYAERALELAPAWPYPRFTLWPLCVVLGRGEEADEQLRALLQQGAIPSPVADFGYNLLASADPGGIILTNGDNDTYPTLALQATRGTRTDVVIVNLSLLNVPEYARTVWMPRAGGEAAFTPEEITTLYQGWEESRKERPALTFLRALLDRVRDGRWKRPVYFAVTVAPGTIESCDQKLEVEGLLCRVTSEKKEAGGETTTSLNLEKTRRLLETDYRLESATDLAFPWTPDSSVRKLMLNYPAVMRLVAAESAKRGDLASVRFALRLAVRMLDFHGEKDKAHEMAKYWKEIDPDNPEVDAWL